MGRRPAWLAGPALVVACATHMDPTHAGLRRLHPSNGQRTSRDSGEVTDHRRPTGNRHLCRESQPAGLAKHAFYMLLSKQFYIKKSL